jgi:ATP-binding cassette subfamily B protein/subfamily B ATP-binding cassette protein MsbA
MDHHASSKQRMKQFRRNPPPPVDLHGGSNGQNGDAQVPRANPEDRRKYLRDYARWLWPYRWPLGAVFFMAIVAAGMDAIWPLAIRAAINLPGSTLSEDQKLRQLMLLGVGTCLLLLVKQAIETLRSYRTATLNAKVTFRLRGRLFEKVLSLPLSTLGEMKSGGIVARLSGDVDSVSGLVQQAIISPGVAGIRIILGVIIIFWMIWRLGLAALIILPPMAVLSFLWIRRVRPIYRSIREDRTSIDGRVTETFGGIRVVRAFRREPHEEHSYAMGHHTVIRKSLYAEQLDLILSTVWGLLIPGSSLIIVWFGVRLVLNGKATSGDIFALQLYALLLIQPVWQIIASVSQTQRSLAAMERIFSVLEMREDKPDVPGAVDAPDQVEEMRFDHVGFEYRPGVAVIRDFNLNVLGGQIVALVGPSGAGKTTLTDLVARFHDPSTGAILLNGIDLRNIKLKSYRSLLAVVQQETFLFDGTIRENIGYGRRGVTDEDVIDAAQRANAHEFITRLPDGYQTLIGERGFKLSGGQRQRLSIARAILANPQILILDEATSNLDTESEQLIQASLGELFKGRTTFVIAHRLSTITHADLIVVIDQGKVIETGNHESLMQNRGLYYEMVNRQQKSFDVMGMPIEVAD